MNQGNSQATKLWSQNNYFKAKAKNRSINGCTKRTNVYISKSLGKNYLVVLMYHVSPQYFNSGAKVTSVKGGKRASLHLFAQCMCWMSHSVADPNKKDKILPRLAHFTAISLHRHLHPRGGIRVLIHEEINVCAKNIMGAGKVANVLQVQHPLLSIK